jgi:hypothetical protein
VDSISLMTSTYSVQNMILYMRERRPIHLNQTGLLKERITHWLAWLISCWTPLDYLRHGGGNFIDFMSCPKYSSNEE